MPPLSKSDSGFLVFGKPSINLKPSTMEDIFQLLEAKQPNLVVQVSGKDLMAFAEAVAAKAGEAERKRQQESNENAYMTKNEVKELIGVCDATLWHWQRNAYLSPVKVGRKVFYKKSDVQRILSSKENK